MIHFISTEKKFIQETSFSQKRFIAQTTFYFQTAARQAACPPALNFVGFFSRSAVDRIFYHAASSQVGEIKGKLVVLLLILSFDGIK